MVERICHGTLAHTLMTVLSGIRLSEVHGGSSQADKQRRLSTWEWMWSIGPSVLYHGTMNFVLLSISAMKGSLIWEHPKDTKSLVAVYGIGAGMMSMLALHVNREWKKLKQVEKAS